MSIPNHIWTRVVSEFNELLSIFARREKGLKGYLAGTTLWNISINAVSIVISFVISLMLSRILGAKGYGIFSYVFAWVSVAAVIAGMGFHVLLTRETTIYSEKKAWGLLKGLLIWSNVLVGSAAIVLIIGIYALTITFNIIGDPLIKNALLLALAALPLVALTNLQKGVLQGVKKPVIAQIPVNIIRPGFLLISMSVVYLFTNSVTITNAILFNVLGFFVMLVVSILLVTKHVPNSVRNTKANFQKQIWLSSGLAFFAISIFSVLDTWTDVLMLGMLGSSKDVGIYQVAKRIALFVSLLLNIVNIALAPIITELFVKGEVSRLQQIITKTIRIIFLLSLTLALVLAFSSEWILNLFGSSFVNGRGPLLILMVGEIINVAAGSVGYLLSMTHNEKYTTWGLAIGVAVNIILNALLIPKFGMKGAAFATLLSLIVWNVLMVYWLYKNTTINSTIFSSKIWRKRIES